MACKYSPWNCWSNLKKQAERITVCVRQRLSRPYQNRTMTVSIHSGACLLFALPAKNLTWLLYQQVMETKSMLYLVTEFAKNGEIFGKQENIFLFVALMLTSDVCQLCLSRWRIPFTVVCHFPLLVKKCGITVTVSYFRTKNFRENCQCTLKMTDVPLAEDLAC